MSSVCKHGGNLRQISEKSGLSRSELVDFSANINPLGFPEWLRPLISSQLSDLMHYPDPEAVELTLAIAEVNDTNSSQVLVANGASELLHLLPQVLNPRRVVLPVPSYVEYANGVRQAGLTVEPFPLFAAEGFRLCPELLGQVLMPGDMVILGQPNNPTGIVTDPLKLKELVDENRDVQFVIDESFIDFAGLDSSLRWQRPANVIIVQSMTKSWAIPGLRLGYLLADEPIVTAVRQKIPEWSVNSLAQAVGVRAMADKEFLPHSRAFVTQQREKLFQSLSGLVGINPFPSDTNFILARVDHHQLNGSQLVQALMEKGVILRDCSNFANLGSDYVRIAVRGDAERERLLKALHQVLEVSRPSKKSKKTPAIMFQGTGSNAGKSVLTAALCRILHQDGLSVAPFKAQNMSLNSCVTFQGGEMGRAQVLQAQASRLDPDVRMNPVLLKPSSETGSQVILCGEVLETMDFRDYAGRREALFGTVQECYDSLASEHQVMVLEGAGSPAEINLKKRDIVNMNMARYAEAGVMLVGDIDRGGVFASFVGSMELLNEWERDLVKGFVINRFRGDATLLKDALDMTSLHSGKPFFGTVPYLPELGLPEEDSVDFKDGLMETVRGEGDVLDIALIDLPHVSNFTDLDALRIEPDAHVRKVTKVSDLGIPDAVILPGSKNVINDLAYLQQTGFDVAIKKLAQNGQTEIVGICGGYQLIGGAINDPHGIESSGCECTGLGLLPMETVLQPGKTTTHCKATHLISGESLYGYEIHHGTSHGDALQPLVKREDGELIGSYLGGKDWIWGTYLHGVFDADGFRRWFLNRLRVRKGWDESIIQTCYDLEPALDRLADHVRASMEMDRIYQVLGL